MLTIAISLQEAKLAAQKEKEELQKLSKKANSPSSDDAKSSTGKSAVRDGNIEQEKATPPTVNLDDAMKTFNSGNYKKSSEQFDEILNDQPKNAEALYFGGISDYINEKTNKSEKNFDKLLKDGSRYTEGSKWYKANILLKKGKKDEAKKLLNELGNSNGSYKERALKKLQEN